MRVKTKKTFIGRGDIWLLQHILVLTLMATAGTVSTCFLGHGVTRRDIGRVQVPTVATQAKRGSESRALLGGFNWNYSGRSHGYDG